MDNSLARRTAAVASRAIALAALGLCASHCRRERSTALTADSRVPQTTSSAAGARAAIPTFSKDVAPILYKNCIGCHRPGEIAPMSLLTYDDARPHAKAIRDEVGDGNMPPWHADPKHGKFANDRSLTAADRETLLRWANNGAPKGDPKDLPAPPRFVDGWTIGEPDSSSRFPTTRCRPRDSSSTSTSRSRPTSPRTSGSRRSRSGPAIAKSSTTSSSAPRPPQPERRPAGFQFAEGMDVPAGQTGGPAEPDGGPKRARGRAASRGRSGPASRSAASRPARDRWPSNPDAAMLLRKGSTIVLQMHYTTNGKEAVDRTKIGFFFAKQPPTEEVRFANARQRQLHDSGRRAGLRGHGGDGHDRRRHAAADAAAHAPARQELGVHGDLSRRPLGSAPRGAEVRLQLADRLRVRRAAEAARRGRGSEPSRTTTTRRRTRPIRIRRPTSKWGDQTWEEMMFTAFVYSLDGVTPGDRHAASAAREPVA